MNELLSVFQILGAMAELVVPPIVFARWLAGSGRPDLSELFRVRSDLPRAAGVQEEDLPAFRFDRLESKRGLRPVLTALESQAVSQPPCAERAA